MRDGALRGRDWYTVSSGLEILAASRRTMLHNTLALVDRTKQRHILTFIALEVRLLHKMGNPGCEPVDVVDGLAASGNHGVFTARC